MRPLLLIPFVAALLIGCTSYPEEVKPVSDETFGYADTVRVYVWGGASITDTRARWNQPDRPTRAWLDKHDYVFLRARIDTMGTRLLQESAREANDEPLKTKDGDIVITGHRYYVRVE